MNEAVPFQPILCWIVHSAVHWVVLEAFEFCCLDEDFSLLPVFHKQEFGDFFHILDWSGPFGSSHEMFSLVLDFVDLVKVRF